MYLGNATIDLNTRQGDRAYQQDAADWHHDRNRITAAVADGMGSGTGSARIATMAVTLALNIADAYGPEQPGAAIAATSDCVRDLTRDDRNEKDNTTLVVATVEASGDVRVAWVGDSRAYVLTRRGRLHQLTKDHNEAPYAPNVLTRTLLGPDLYHRHTDGLVECTRHRPEFAEYSDSFDPAVMVVLMTDGVCGVLTDNQINSLLSSASTASGTDGRVDASRAASRLTAFGLHAARALDKKADNATALVIDLGESLES